MNNNMYLYFDSNGYLKEFITCPARAGSENVNSIYFYVEPALESDRDKVGGNGDAYYALPNNLDHGVLTFKLHDVLDGITDENGTLLNSLAFTSANFRIEDIQPFDKKRDLLFFKWFQKYQFVKVDLTSDILLNPGNVECTIGCYNASNTKVYNLDLFSFYIADSAVQSANYVTTSQYHMLLALMQSGLSGAVSRYNIDASDTLADIYNLIGTQISVLNIDDKEYLVEMSNSGSIVLYDLYNREWYAYEGSDTTAIDDITRYLYRYHIATKEDLENFGNLFTYKGTASVAQINALTDIGNGWCYNLTDSGTLTLGNLSVETGDNVAFDGTVWTKLSSETVLGNYYTKQEGQEFEQDVNNRIESFENGVNNQIDTIENQVQQVASGSPKGVYATLAALQAAYPTGATGIYVVSADGHWYYWNGSAWTDGGTYLSDANYDALGIETVYVNDDVISYKEITLTLANENTIWNSNGQIVSANYYTAINEPIPVLPGETYIFKNLYGNIYTTSQLMFLDENMANGVSSPGVSSDTFEYTVPSGKYFVCITMATDSVSKLSSVQVIGKIDTGKCVLTKVNLTSSQINQVLNNIPDNSLKAQKMDFIELEQNPNFEDDTNMVEDVSWTSGYMRATSGQLVTSEYVTQYIASDFIEVVSGYKYRLHVVDGNHVYAVFFSNLKNDGTDTDLGWIGDGDYVEVTVPEGKTFVSFNCVYNHSNKISSMNRLTQTDDEKDIIIPRLVVSNQNKLSGKKIVNFGDSIFGQARPPVDISTLLASLIGATVYNAGFGGCQMAQHAEQKWDAFSMYRLAYAIANNDWTLQDNAIANNPDLPSYFAETITMLKGLDFSKIDYITIGYGINDFNNGISLNSQTTNGFKYCLDYSINTLLTAFPKLKVYICTMTYGFDSSNPTSDTNNFTHTSWVDGTSSSYIDFVEGQKDVAKSYQLPIIDLYYDLGINKTNKLQYFSVADGTHQNINGRKLIAELMAYKLW